jgi:hypothetical protein
MARCKCKTKLGAQCKNAAKPGFFGRCGTHYRYVCTLFQQPSSSSSRGQQPSSSSSSRGQQPSSSSSRGQQPSSSRGQQQQKPPCYKTMCDLNLTSKASAAKWLIKHKEDKGDHGVHTQVNTCFGSSPRVFCEHPL